MKSKVQVFLAKTLAAISIFVGASLVNAALAEITADEVYLVGVKRTTQLVEHENAVFAALLLSPPPNKEVGVMFMQTKGTHAFVPFMCSPANWHPASQSYSCSKETQVNPTLQLRETLTIGKLPGNFCKNQRETHNAPPPHSPHADHPIMTNGECPVGAAHCSCYEVLHECRADASGVYAEANCPNPIPTANARPAANNQQGLPVRGGGAPPTRGSGSGGSN